MDKFRKDPRDGLDYDIHAYDLKSNLWHHVERCRHLPNFEGRNALCNGSLFWMSGKFLDFVESFIVALDLVTEKFRIVSNPEYTDSRIQTDLDSFEGFLSLSCHYEESGIVDIWLLEDYGGNNEHWSKMISLSLEHTEYLQLRTLKHVAYSKTGKKVLMWMDYVSKASLVWYNIEYESVEPIAVHDLVHGTLPYFQVQCCWESLVNVTAAITEDVEIYVVFLLKDKDEGSKEEEKEKEKDEDFDEKVCLGYPGWGHA
ncbi:F-box protein At5g62510-like [Impatiens glandulifera]|uniref:F-box protein At5g62510-like n=1 Tax=Impatiens glandulifera TaxID=253017 RepID=UPI001FB0E9B5|nr:F-box protein At5g62510-like [Impatiens glandulifera]